MNLLPPIQVGEKRDLPVEPGPTTTNQSVNIAQDAGDAVFNMSLDTQGDFLMFNGTGSLSWIHPT